MAIMDYFPPRGQRVILCLQTSKGTLMALGYIGSKKTGKKIGWVEVLAFVDLNRRVTPDDVFKNFSLGRKMEVKHRGRFKEIDTGPAEASTRLRRLQSWGMLEREPVVKKKGEKKKPGRKPAIYLITDYGKEVLNNPRMGKRKKS